MVLDDPDVVGEVRAAFDRYEKALVSNDTAALDALFWDSPHTVRYGNAENLYGIEEIRAFRSARSPIDLDRELAKTVIHTFGRDFAVAATLYRRRGSGKTGRQMQTWLRTADGWRVVAAHVSFVDFPFPTAS
jgi:ketosteroid isomerase-like protein